LVAAAQNRESAFSSLTPEQQKTLKEAATKGDEAVIEAVQQLTTETPAAAAEIAAAAAEIAPNIAPQIAATAALASPSLAAQIATSVATLVPSSAASIATSVAQAVPSAAAAVAGAVASVAPSSEPQIAAEAAAAADPFNAQGWTTSQRAHAEQHPSYTRLVLPELLRPRDALEAFPRERLQYVGHMASGAALEALVKVLPPNGAKKDEQMTSVYRVRLGQRLGQDFGKVMGVQPDQLLVQELALAPTGEWQTRELRLPLQEAAP
jgi:type IV pilus assembly protein PilP